MKQIKLISLLFLFFILYSCEKDAEIAEKSYPLVVLNEVEVGNDYAKFNATITNYTNTNVDKFGFFWENSDGDLNINTSYLTYAATINENGEYSTTISSDLLKSETYNVKPVALQGNKTIIGDILSFESQGGKEPTIAGFYPCKGDTGDTITVEGKYFSLKKSRNKVFVGENEAPVVSVDTNSVKFCVPQKLSVSKDVIIKVISGEDTVYSNDYFSIDRHRIADFNPKSSFMGETEIVIEGNGFLSAGNTVKIGEYTPTIISESETEIHIKTQLCYMDTRSYHISVTIDGVVTTSDSLITCKTKWIKQDDFPGEGRVGSYASIVNDKLFVICGGTYRKTSDSPMFYNDIWLFDLNSETWGQINDFPGKGRQDGVGFTIDNTIYYGMGISADGYCNDFWKLDVESMTWTQLNDFVFNNELSEISFSLSSKGYVIDKNEIWEYDPGNDNWTFLQEVPLRDNIYPAQWNEYYGHTSLNNIEYFMILETMIGYDPESSEPFTAFCTIPWAHYGNMLNLNNKILFNKYYRYYLYDPEDNTYIQVECFPNEPHRRKGIAVGYNGKGYIGLGYEHVSSDKKLYNDFYIYDSTLE